MPGERAGGGGGGGGGGGLLRAAGRRNKPEEQLFSVGCGVQLAPDFEEYSDAKDGPLKPGDKGVLIEDDGSSKPFRVEFDGRTWWYDRSALRVAELSKSR